MFAGIEISDKDIARAESILLSEGQTFDKERVDFIKCMESVDLQAVPGSGKTTALLAKLVILERFLPFADGSAVLVISHTNAAVDEIRSRLSKNCPCLFSYPNFVGTIQSFTDTYLAIPSFVREYGFRPSRIDAEAYDSAVSKHYLSLNHKAKAWANQRSEPEKFLKNLRFDKEENLTDGLGGRIVLRSSSSSPTYKALSGMKKSLFKEGLLHFEDAFYFAETMLAQDGAVKRLLRKRFTLVFVDEMQDMSSAQNSLINQLFGEDESDKGVFQRVGDPDQAIFQETTIESEPYWQVCQNFMTLNNSLRLSPSVANVITPFAYRRDDGFEVCGLNDSELKPHLLVYDDNSILLVLKRFAELVVELREIGSIPQDSSPLYKAIAWNATWKDTHDPTDPRLRLIDFFPAYDSVVVQKEQEYNSLEDYIISVDTSDCTLRGARNAIVRGIVHALRLEGVVDPKSGRPFSPASLTRYFAQETENRSETWKMFLFQCSVQILSGQYEPVLQRVRKALPRILHLLGKPYKCSKEFIENVPCRPMREVPASGASENCLVHKGIKVHVGTVHSVKGQTHTATLYIESSYQKDGTGANAKYFESQRLAPQFAGERISRTAGERVKESARMVYVGFSRPTHLLAFAVHRSRFDAYLSQSDLGRWEVVRLYLENSVD